MTATSVDASKPKWPPAGGYPKVRRDESFTEQYQSKEKAGIVTIPDPYHWLSEPPSESKETKAFVDAQVDFTENYLNQIETRDKFRNSVTKAWNYPKTSVPSLKGNGFYYMSYNSGLQNQSVIYQLKDIDNVPNTGNPGDVFLDPNTLSSDGTSSLSTSAFSKDGSLYAYAVSKAGSDWTSIHIKPTDLSKPPFDEVLEHVKFTTIAWTHDNKGFFYQRLPSTSAATASDLGTGTDADRDAYLVYHRVGTPQSEDVTIIQDHDNPTRTYMAEVTDDGAFVCVYVAQSTANENLFWVAPLDAGVHNLNFNKVVDEWGYTFSYVANDGDLFFITSNKDAPNTKLHTFNIQTREHNDILPHDPKRPLQYVFPVATNKLFVCYLEDARNKIYIYDLYTGKELVQLVPDLVGSLTGIACRRDQSTLFFSTQSFTSPTTIYKVDFSSDSPTAHVWRQTHVPGIDPSEFISEQVFYTSKDGTRVPMFITRHKSVKNNASAPALQYGYGGFGISITPTFSPHILTWAKHYRGIYAVANIRGGGEYGEAWHQAGMFENKQNVFDDFIAATHFLIDNKYAHPNHVAIEGRSNGGLLVGACLTQAPHLYGAALPEVGVLDMLHFHRYTIGGYWRADYGDPDKPQDFDYISKYSPLHNIDPTKEFPPTLVITSDHDDRVVPLHSFKFISELQHLRPQNKSPLLIRVTTNSGHGAGMSTERQIAEIVDRYSFISYAQGLQWYD